MRNFKTILVTGGAGFIGSNLIQYLFGYAGFTGRVVNLDALTYAGKLESHVDRSILGHEAFIKTK